ncbi:hypothetical protein [Marinobacter daepoensis]|uniref:hypothetical protein n=1 Tax=Marinobacter daepoensis TaxID=262077 RepID=UPI003B84B454
MTSLPDRQQAVALIHEAQSSGARLAKACALLNLSVRTFQRWTTDKAAKADQRPLVPRPAPTNKLTDQERQAVVSLSNQKKYQSCPPAFIVADQMDQGHYLASESTFYRGLREHGQVNPRGRQKAPQPKRQATTHQATEPNQLWSWDISWLPGPARGTRFYPSSAMMARLIRSWLSTNRLSRLRRPRTRGAGPVISETSAYRNQ